jgi:hypothetical protein
MAHAQAAADLGGGRLARDRGERAVDVQRGGAARVAEILRPGFARAVRGELDAVAVGVREVDGLVRAVVRGAVDRRARRGEPDDGARQW